MASETEKRLEAMGLRLPDAPAPVANYLPYVKTGNLVFVAGQVPHGPDGDTTGRLGETVTVEEGAAAARLCALNLIAQVKAACGGDLDRLVRVVKLTGFVNCGPDFKEHPQVINGASDFMVELLGERGKHARAAVGSSSLPFGFAVEIDGVFEVS